VGAEGLGELGREPPDRAGGPENQGLLAGLDLADIADRLAVLTIAFMGCSCAVVVWERSCLR
jgi:hypothetical protein